MKFVTINSVKYHVDLKEANCDYKFNNICTAKLFYVSVLLLCFPVMNLLMFLKLFWRKIFFSFFGENWGKTAFSNCPVWR